MTAVLPDHPLLTIACHCLDCQRRTGAPFGVLSYYREDRIVIGGEARPYRRTSAGGDAVETFFCPNCGSTVYVKLAKQPGLVGIAVGAIADPAHPPPAWSVWEESRHHWMHVSCDVRRFPRGD
ncbi:MAG: GFA family protein [Sphingomonas sp.]